MQEPTYTEPRGRWTIPLLSAIALLVIQLSTLGLVYGQARRALERDLATKLESAAVAAGSLLKLPPAGQAGDAELGQLLWRLRESHQLELVALVDRDGLGIAGTDGTEPGSRLSAFEVNPARVRRVIRTGRSEMESVMLLGEPYRRLYHPLAGGRGPAVLCLAAYDPMPAGLVALQRATGAAVVVSVCAALVMGAIVFWMRRMAAAARVALLRRERLETAGALAASIAHDLKNPLATLVSSAQLLESSGGVADADLVRTIAEEARWAGDQVETFLDLAREVPVHLKAEDLGAVTRQVVESFAARARQANVGLEASIPAAPTMAMLDRRKVRRVVANLLLNALEAVDRSGRGRIRVSVDVTRDEPVQAVVCVEDNGTGMSAGLRERAVEPFFTTKETGTGLGLALARQVAEQHGGRIGIRSAPGEGTAVSLLLPRM